MAKYNFGCECGKSNVLYTSFDAVIFCECGLKMEPSLPTIAPITVTEKVDKNSNTNWIKDQKEVLTARSEEYFWSVEVPRFVESGIYSLETMLERGWIYKDAKGQYQTRTRPPSS